MSKNKAAQQRREKKKAQRKAERRGKKRQQIVNVRAKPSVLPGYETYTDEAHAIWTAHGINFLASDYAKGIWAPVFPDIYEGAKPTIEEVISEIVRRYRSAGQVWDMAHKAEIAWALQSKQTAYAFMFEAQRRLQALDADADVMLLLTMPRHGQVWEFFDFVKDQIIKEPVKQEAKPT